jgi:hypothetical protein
MSSDDYVVDGGDFLKLSKALKAAGRTKMRNGLNKGMRNAAKPLIPVARAAFRAQLPHKGGAGEFIAGKTMRAKTYTGKNPGVSILVIKQDPRLDSQGRLAHPVFNKKQKANPNKRAYVVQQVKPGIFSDALQAKAPAIRKDIEKAISDVLDDIVKGA